MKLDEKIVEESNVYVVLVANLPYFGPNLRIDPQVSFNDGFLDVFIFPDVNKLNLIAYGIQSLSGSIGSKTFKHYRARRLTITAEPEMGLMADGSPIGRGAVSLACKPSAFVAMAGSTRGHGPKRDAVKDLKQTNNGNQAG